MHRAFVHREANTLDAKEAQQYPEQVHQALLEELQRGLNLGAFERMPKQIADNVIDACWATKWKNTDDQWRIKSRLVVRGFKDLQAERLSTFAGTTSRWGQRIVNSIAVQKGWELFSADVSQAFLRGLTLDEAATQQCEVSRTIQFAVPPGCLLIFQQLPGFEDFNPLTEVLNMLRCGFGLKDAPRLWNNMLKGVLTRIGSKPTNADPQPYVWHITERAVPTDANNTILLLMVSIHVDDLKCAGEVKYRNKLISELEVKFEKLATKLGSFECIGVMHEQDVVTKEIVAHQMHHVPQISSIEIDSAAFARDDQLADTELRQLYMSLVGALAWLLLTMSAICVCISYLQRHTQATTLNPVKLANRLHAWITRNREKLVIYYRRLLGPLRLLTLSDSAFKAQDTQGLVMRGCIILLVEGGSDSAESSVAYNPKTSDMTYRTTTNVKCHVLDWCSWKHSRIVRSTYAAELLRATGCDQPGAYDLHVIAKYLTRSMQRTGVTELGTRHPHGRWG